MTAKIGLSEEDMTELGEMETPMPEPKFDYQPWEDSIRLADGTERGMGFALVRWIWGYLEPEWYAQLKAFCPGASAHVFISTKLPDDSFADFAADMVWPKQDSLRTMGNKPDVVIEFRNLEAL